RVGRAGAEDLAQETLLRAYRGLRTLVEPDKFGPWLCGIAVRTCLDWLKSRDRTHVPFSVLVPNAGADQVLDRPSLAEPELDREIRPDDAAELAAHLAGCPACRAAEESFRLQDGDLRRAFAPRRAAADRVAQGVIARLPAGPTWPLPRLPWLTVFLSAAAGF